MNASGAKRLLSAGDSAGIDSGGMLGVYQQTVKIRILVREEVCFRFVVGRGWLATATGCLAFSKILSTKF